MNRLRRNFFLHSLFTIVFMAAFSTMPAPLNAAPERERNRLTLRKYTVEGNIINPLKINLINLHKNRRERIERQLKGKVILRKRFFRKRAHSSPAT